MKTSRIIDLPNESEEELKNTRENKIIGCCQPFPSQQPKCGHSEKI